LKGEKPLSVYAELKQYKPDVYPRVDDDATLLLSYPSLEGVIHASWNWPFNRKDMHVYGTTGYIFMDDPETIRYRLDEQSTERVYKVPQSEVPFNEPFAYFAAAIKGEVEVGPTDLSSLEINVTVVEILEAARESSKTGRKVELVRQEN
jgi:predicted dehydrogenase